MQSVMSHNFSQVAPQRVPHSVFDRSFGHKTTMEPDYLVPFLCDEVVPGDSYAVSSTFLVRLNALLHPFMDNLFIDTFYFFVPYRLVWDNWVKMCGEQDNPGDSTDYVVPKLGVWVSNVEDHSTDDTWESTKPGSLADYFGVPVSQWRSEVEYQFPDNRRSYFACNINALPFRAYRLIWNEWFRDENLQGEVSIHKGDNYRSLSVDGVLLKRGKRHDYFTSCLPWPQKGPAVTLPMGQKAPVGIEGAVTAGGDTYEGFMPLVGMYRRQLSSSTDLNAALYSYNSPAVGVRSSYGIPGYFGVGAGYGTDVNPLQGNPGPDANVLIDPLKDPDAGGYKYSSAFADLTSATAVTIDQLIQAFSVQDLYRIDARGGTRYTEILQSHFGVANPDARLQRPEYLGGSSQRINVTSVPQTSASTADSKQANLAAYSVTGARSGFQKTFGEYGLLIGLMNIRADLTYQQGLDRMWRKETRFDFYWPALANLGEQAVLESEIYCHPAFSTTRPTDSNNFSGRDDNVFGYQERYAEYRYKPSKITGYLNSSVPDSMQAWHLSQFFSRSPNLNSSFIESNTPISRVVGYTDLPPFLVDSFITMKCARPMPVYSIPATLAKRF